MATDELPLTTVIRQAEESSARVREQREADIAETVRKLDELWPDAGPDSDWSLCITAQGMVRLLGRLFPDLPMDRIFAAVTLAHDGE